MTQDTEQSMPMREMPTLSGNTAIIVAHGDDETLWCGGLLARYKGFDVYCCSIPQDGPERVLDFCRAVKLLGHHPFILPFPEKSPDTPLEHLELLDLDGYDTIITHNAKGEYGHLHHRQIHAYLFMRFIGNLFCFGYGLQNTDFVLNLSQKERDEKLAALRCYDRQADTEKRGGVTKSDALLKILSDLDLNREFYIQLNAPGGERS